MTAEELLCNLTERDVAVTVAGERLRIDAPNGVLTEALRLSLSEHKPELVELVRHRSASACGGLQEGSAETDCLAAMPLREFAKAGLVVRVHSKVLGQDVLFVSDDVPDAKVRGQGLPVYRASELRKLAILRPCPRSLHRIHDLKTIFHGAITDVR